MSVFTILFSYEALNKQKNKSIFLRIYEFSASPVTFFSLECNSESTHLRA